MERKPSKRPLRPAAVRIALHLDRHPTIDYLPLNSQQREPATGSWTAMHRNHEKRQLVDIQQVKNDSLLDLNSLSAISNPYVAHPIAVYYYHKRAFFVQEHVALSVLELAPLCEHQIAYIFTQVLSGLQYLLVLGIGFQVTQVRTTVTGDIKMVLDWSYEPNISPVFRLAGTSYLADFLRNMFGELRGGCRNWSAEACDFVTILEAGYLPASTHPFLSRTLSIRSVAWFVMQRKLAALPPRQIDLRGSCLDRNS
ncbi:hypothetical protein IF1G_11096 [Cordyceps javanica]|uniref:Uncharacterized protein n=1 Tax=Cordyceps javanica TaxID=43265 RepID=A0A545ULB9_9HYPO|nr:hypothetical protein IF1G_11096 [Cordyceps javanica]